MSSSSTSKGTSGVGLSIKVSLDDKTAKENLNKLLKDNNIQLTFNSESLTQVEKQLKELSALKFDKLLNESTLAQFENMTTQLKSQVESVQAMKKAFSEMKLPTGSSDYGKAQMNLYKEATDLQKQIQAEEEKLATSTGKETQKRRENLVVLKEHLQVLQSQITDQQLLLRLESQMKALKASGSNGQLDLERSKQLTKQKKAEAAETQRATALQVDGYQMIGKLNEQIFQQNKKLFTATETEKQAIRTYIQSLQQMKQEMIRILSEEGLISERKEHKEFFNDTLRLGKLQLEQVHQEELALKRINKENERKEKRNERLNAQDSKRIARLSEEKRISKMLVENAQKEYEIKIKSLTNGRNGKYVDQYNLAGFQQQLANLDSKASTKNVREQLRKLSLAFRELSVDANVARLQQTGGVVQALNQSFQNLAKYVTGAMIIRKFFNELRQGIQDVRDLDSAMTTLRMTMIDFTEQDISKLINKSVELSKSLKTNVSDVLEAVKTVANAGETMESIMNKTKPALIISNLSGSSIGDSVNMIQSATRQFDDLKDASEASTMAVADSMIAISKSLGMDFSEGIRGMSDGLTILGSVANQFGMDLNETLSMLAATAETTRGTFSETATSIKTIMARTMRIGGLDENVSLDDMLKTEKALASIGVGIRNLETNEMRDFRAIIQDLNDKFGDLDEATQSYIAENVSATV